MDGLTALYARKILAHFPEALGGGVFTEDRSRRVIFLAISVFKVRFFLLEWDGVWGFPWKYIYVENSLTISTGPLNNLKEGKGALEHEETALQDYLIRSTVPSVSRR